MRGKVAKRLRREAREATIGMPALQYLQGHHPRRGLPVVVDPNSTRGFYKQLKKAYKRG